MSQYVVANVCIVFKSQVLTKFLGMFEHSAFELHNKKKSNSRKQLLYGQSIVFFNNYVN